MDIFEQFRHAETFVQMDTGDKLMATFYVILLGMSITFVALVLIWGLTATMSRIIKIIEKGTSKPVVPVKAEPVMTEVTLPAAQEEDDTELVAIITAAIAASMNTSIHNIVVTNITRVHDHTPAWGRAGRSDVMASRTH